MTMNNLNHDLEAAFAAADAGPVLSGTLVPLNNIGALRATYNWLYSALNCDPNDTSPFTWILSRVGTGTQVSLSPQQPYAGMQLFASIRPDNGYTAELQAPGSADWITAVGADEIMTLTQQGMLTISLQGLNGNYLCADSGQTGHDDHTGYVMRSGAGAIGPGASFFVLVSQVHQPLDITLAASLDIATVGTALAAQGAADPAGLAQRILAMRA
jgi:hypothetical protein